jgi:hypothetical protein
VSYRISKQEDGILQISHVDEELLHSAFQVAHQAADGAWQRPTG